MNKMKQKVKKEKHGKFIEQQLDDLKQEQLAAVETIEQDKDKFANAVNETIELTKDTVFNSDYFDEAFRKIDADRISTQMDIKKIDEEIEKEEKKETEEAIRAKKEIITKKYNEAASEQHQESSDTEIVETKQEEKKVSFFDKLLQIL